MKNPLYQIYYKNPEMGEIVVAIIRGKKETIKRLNQLAQERPDILFYIKEYQE